MTPSRTAARGRRAPARRLAQLYFAFAHLCLALACAALALDPAAYAGFFYHPRMISLVHLVTLGWISGSILGALHLVGPRAPRAPGPVAARDRWAFGAFVAGVTGIVSHFWIGELSGVGWSGLLVTLVFLHAGARTLRALRGAKIPAPVKLHFALAFVNVGVAALSGALFGFNRWAAFLPGSSYLHALAHAHLAALGWATMMVFAIGYQVLPKLLPAAVPSESGGRVCAALLEIGVLGIFFCLLSGSAWLPAFAALTVAGIAAFLVQVGWMLRHRKPSPGGPRRPDPGVVQAALALVYLAVTAGLGSALTLLPADGRSLRLIWLYGVGGLLGFLGQIVAAFGRPGRRLQAAILILWTVAVPLLAAGLYGDHLGWVRLAAVLLLVAALLGGGAWQSTRGPRDTDRHNVQGDREAAARRRPTLLRALRYARAVAEGAERAGGEYVRTVHLRHEGPEQGLSTAPRGAQRYLAVVPAGRQDRRPWPERCRQEHAPQDHGR